MIAYPIIAGVLIYLLAIFPRVASRVGYRGSNLEEFVEIVIGRKTSILTTVLILFFNISVSVCGVIFSVKFVNYSLCELGNSQCGNLWLINGAGVLLCLPFAFIHNVSAFVYVTIGCLVVIMASLFMIGGNMVRVIGTYGTASSTNMMNWSFFPQFFGMACFSLEGIGLIFPIRGSLAKPQIFTKLFISVATFAVIVYIVFGTLCNFALGGATKQIIFHNFPKTYSMIFAMQFMYAIGIFTTFPLYIQACVNTIKKLSFMKGWFEKKDYMVSTMARGVFIVLMFAICLTGVNLVDFMDLAGSICNSFLAFILPVMVLIWYKSSVGELSKLEKWIHILIAVVGVVLSCVTIAVSFYTMINGHHKHAKHFANPLV